MEFEYIKEDKQIRITGVTEYLAANPTVARLLLFINDTEVDAASPYSYTVTSDGITKISMVAYTDSALHEIVELGYNLTIEYAKAKNRALMISILDNTTFYGLSSLWTKNNKLIREIEYSFYSGNIIRSKQLLAEIKWN